MTGQVENVDFESATENARQEPLVVQKAVRRLTQQPPARDRQEPPDCAHLLVNFGPETGPRFAPVVWAVKTVPRGSAG